MTRRLIILMILLCSASLSPLWALNYGARFIAGPGMGIGLEWNEALKDAGSTSFNKAVPTVGIGVFGELNVSPKLLFTPEMYYVLNRGVQMADDSGNYIKTRAVHSMELILPLAYDIDFDSGSKAFRVSGGLQCLYSFNLKQDVKVNEIERLDSELQQITPFSTGFIIGGGLEINKKKKMSWLFDIRTIIPFSAGINYKLPDGSEKRFKTLEILLGSGIKF